ncbi:MAG: 2-hydroxyacid dehydrogenase [Thermaerobacter sp.]|nr:2-hydroxyacid dehydrogenase [Thermaerobacter sp.]
MQTLPLVLSTLEHPVLRTRTESHRNLLELVVSNRFSDLPQEVRGRVKVLLAGHATIGERELALFPAVEFIQTVGSGYNHIDVAAAEHHQVLVAHNPGHNAQAVAEHALMATLYFLRRMGELHNLVLAGRFSERASLMGRGIRDAHGVTLGIWGMGYIGQTLVKLVSPLGMNLLYSQRRRRLDLEELWQMRYVCPTDLLRSVDVLVMTLPLTPETRHILGKEQLALMKQDAVVINVGRGELIDTRALIDALTSEEIYAAALDVFETEPLPEKNPLLTVPDTVRSRLLLSPHVAGATNQALAAMVGGALDNVVRFLEGRPVQNLLTASLKIS